MSFAIYNDDLNINEFNPTSGPELFPNLQYLGIGMIPQYQLDVNGTISFDSFADISNNIGNDTNVIKKVSNNTIWSYNNYGVNDIFPTGIISTISQILPSSGSRPYHFPSLAPNGKIYCMPYNLSSYAIIDTITDTITTKTSTLAFQAGGSVCASNGKIYSPTLGGTGKIRVLDTINGDLEYLLDCDITRGYCGCCLAPNGKIYCVPSDFPLTDPKVMVIDPSNDSVSYITVSGTNWPSGDGLTGGIGNANGDDVWYGGVLAPNGKIYCMPARGTSILVIDPIANTAQCDISGLDGFATATIPGGQANKYSSGILAPNGKIYGLPGVYSSNVIEINPNTNTYITTSLTISSGTTRKCVGGTLGMDGKIYCSTDNAGIIAIINLEPTLSLTTISSPRGNGTCLSPNGKIYILPNLSGGGLCQMRKINTGIRTKETWMLAPEFNKY